ncbi:MAG: CRISPR-associated endonuclease Cas3'' [Rubrivivax sp.]|nr:CRISPR-associated endonuclease Cas3'' [Rubrivivax sp.]
MSPLKSSAAKPASKDWAHAPSGAAGTQGPTDPHLLDDHLRAVATIAAAVAPPTLTTLAHLAGLWHDLGKRRPGFQRYIRATGGEEAHIEGRVADRDKTHSIAGALWAERALSEAHGPEGHLLSRLLQYAIAGHHAGLADWNGGPGSLASRLQSDAAAAEFAEAAQAVNPPDILRPPLAALDKEALRHLLNDAPKGRLASPGRAALGLRMLFSALVDADFLDTEAYFDPQRAATRTECAAIDQLQHLCEAHLHRLGQDCHGPVNALRAQVLTACRQKAQLPPGVFRLTVPTGGGKTLSSLSFALAHAQRHGLQRVVYAIPYTSIIEQTADVFRQVFASLGEDVVVEHHSNAESDPARETRLSRLACENWDAPLVVTTNVQLFESLFASRTSRCRKLHSLARSVIVLDEAQLLPLQFLQPVVDVLRYLVEDYGASVVLCTATQPLLDATAGFDAQRGLRRGIGPVTEIIDDVPALFAGLERVKLHLPASLDTPRAWPEIAAEVASHDAVLAVVNRRADAAELYRLVSATCDEQQVQQTWHLSALMCAQHRSDVLAQIRLALRKRREALAAGSTAPGVRVISTQLVEAGVDLDFPVVFRAMAGLDSIAQAAGRCNREGRLPTLGDVFVFVPPSQPPPGLLTQARDACKAIWHNLPEQPLSLSHVARYFERLLNSVDSTDKHKICELLKLQPVLGQEMALPLQLRSASHAFRLIDDADSSTVLVRYRSPHGREDIDSLIGKLWHEGPARWLMRKLQRHGVTVYTHQVRQLLAAGDIEEVPTCPGLYVQREGWDGFYHPVLGARVDAAPGDPLIS